MKNRYLHHQIGIDAELLACRYLQKQGFKLLQQNYRCTKGEIDLIMQDQAVIVFVEVRYRSSKDYGSALETINKAKISKLKNSATYFLQKKNWLYRMDSRFDIVAINASESGEEIDWIKNAFMMV